MLRKIVAENDNKLIVAVNKIDLLPKHVSMERINKWVVAALGKYLKRDVRFPQN